MINEEAIEDAVTRVLSNLTDPELQELVASTWYEDAWDDGEDDYPREEDCWA